MHFALVSRASGLAISLLASRLSRGPLFLFLAVLAVLLLAPARAPAASIFWDGTGTGWNTAANWSTASNATQPNPASPPGASDTAFFNISTVNTAQTVNLNAAQAALGLSFSSTGSVLIQSGSGTNTLSLGLNGIVVNSGSGADTISNAISTILSQTWTNNSSSLLTLSGSISNGNTTTISGSGATTLSGSVNGNSLTKSGVGTLTLSGNSDNVGLGLFASAGNIVLAKFSTASVHAIGGGGLTIAGGTVQLAGVGSDQIYDNAAVVLNSGTLDFNGRNESFDGFSGAGGVVTDSEAASDSVLTIGLFGANGTFSGIIQNGAGLMHVTKTGAGVETFTGANTFSGATMINQGTLRAGADNTIPSSTFIYISSGGTLDFATFSQNIGGLLSDDGTVQLAGGSLNDTAGNSGSSEFVGNSGTGTFSQTGGTNTLVNTPLVIGANVGSSGTYNLSGTGALVGTGGIHIGASGTGAFNQSGGTNTLNGGSDLYIGQDAGATGSYSLSAGSLTVSSGAEYIGFNGTGTFTQTAGTHSDTSGGIYIGRNVGSNGTYTLTGGSLTIFDNSDISVGYSGTGTFTQSGGTVTITSEGEIFVGRIAGSVGTYNLSGTGSIVTEAEVIGVAGTGTFTQSGGTNAIQVFPLAIGSAVGSNGTYILSGGTLSVTLGSEEYVGQNGTATFTQSGGTHTVGSGSDFYIGYGAGSSGTYTLTGTGTLTIAFAEYVGRSGAGTFTQSGGAHTVNGSPDALYIAYNSSSLSSYSLSAGSLTANGNVHVGYSGTGSFTQTGGIVAINGGAVLTLGDNVGSSGSYALSGTGALTVSTGIENIGLNGTATFTQSGGTHSNSSGNIYIGKNAGSNGTYSLSAGSLSLTLDASIYVGFDGTGTFTQSGGTNSIADSGELFLGRDVGSTGTYNLSGSGALSTIAEVIGSAGTGAFNQSGGTNAVAHFPLEIGFSAGSTGTYTLSGGSLSVTAGDDENLGSHGNGFFTQTGGTHTLDATSNLYIGRSTGSAGTYFLGGSGVLTANLNEYVGYISSGNFTQSGGTNSVTGTLFVGFKAGSTGHYVLLAGTLNAPTVTVKPNSAFYYLGGTWNTAALLTLNGNALVQLAPGGDKVIKVNSLVLDHTGPVYPGKLDLSDDKLILQSASALDKSTKIADLNTAISAGSAGNWTGNGITSSAAAANPTHLGVGVFDNAVLGKATFGGVSADPSSIFVAIAHLGDANRNNIVDIQDLTIVANHWQTAQNNWAAGDLNRDNVVDIQDFTIVANNWQQTSNFSLNPSALTSQDSPPTNVPEPASILLLSLSASLFAKRRKSS